MLRTVEELDGVSSPITFLKFGLGYVPLVEILNPALLLMLIAEIGTSFSVISFNFLLFSSSFFFFLKGGTLELSIFTAGG